MISFLLSVLSCLVTTIRRLVTHVFFYRPFFVLYLRLSVIRSSFLPNMAVSAFLRIRLLRIEISKIKDSRIF